MVQVKVEVDGDMTVDLGDETRMLPVYKVSIEEKAFQKSSRTELEVLMEVRRIMNEGKKRIP